MRRIAFCISIFFEHFKTKVTKENEEKIQNADIYQQMFTKKSNEDDDNVDDSAKDDDNSVGGANEE